MDIHPPSNKDEGQNSFKKIHNREIKTIDYNMGFSFKSKKEKISKKIRKVIEKVCEWRRLSKNLGNGYLSKEEAATRLGIKKKSLDDYLMYLRLSIVLCYDFEQNLDTKFGNLKKFINDFRKSQKWNKGRHKDVDSLEIIIH